MPRFPIAIKTPDGQSPEEERARASKLHYVVAASGVFQVRELPTHRSVTRVTGAVPGLPDQVESVQIRAPRVPRDLLEDALAFFDRVYRDYGGEAIVIPFYDPTTREFRLGVPPQKIRAYRDSRGRRWTDLHLDYASVPLPEGHVRFGTIHSHAEQPAYASHTDCADEQYEDGLHIVFGSFDGSVLSRCASFVANGRRFVMEPNRVMEPCGVPNRAPPEGWMERVDFVEEPWRPYRGYYAESR